MPPVSSQQHPGSDCSSSSTGATSSMTTAFDDDRPMTPEPTARGPPVASPGPTDVICGRGKMTISHPGNLRFRQLIQSQKAAYQQARRRDDKTRITHDLVKQMRNGPTAGRFLLFDPQTELWYDVGDEYAREKVSHSLRSRPGSRSNTSSSGSGGAKLVKRRKRVVRKPEFPPALEAVVGEILDEQQRLLRQLIDKAKDRKKTGKSDTNGQHQRKPGPDMPSTSASQSSLVPPPPPNSR